MSHDPLRMYSSTVCSLLRSFCHRYPLIVESRLGPEAVNQHVSSMAVLMSEIADSDQLCDQLSFLYMQGSESKPCCSCFYSL